MVVRRHRQQRRPGRAQRAGGAHGVVGGEGDVLGVGHPRRPAAAAAQQRHGQRQPDAAVGGGDPAGSDQAERRGDLGPAAGVQAEDGVVEQPGLVVGVEGLGEPHMVGPGQPGAGGGLPGGQEVRRPPVGPGPREEHLGAVRGGHRGQLGLGVPPCSRQHRRQQRLGPGGRARRVHRLHGQRDHRGLAVGGAGGTGVQQHPRAALLPQLHRLGPVLPGVGEPQPAQHVGHDRPGGTVDGELGERVPGQRGGGGQHQRVDRQRGLQGQQRPHGVHRRPGRVGLPEDVVEDLQRQRPGVPGGQHRAEEGGQVEGALAGEEPVVPGPLQDVHRQLRGVGQLQEEQLLLGDGGEAGRVAAARQHVEGVQAQAQSRVVDGADEVPAVVPGGHVGAPGQRLVGDPEPALAGQLGGGVQLGGQLVVVGDRVGRHGRADQHDVHAEGGHDVELRPRPAPVADDGGRVGRVQVAEGLVEVDRQAQVGAVGGQLGRRPRRGDQVGLEHLDAVEPGAGRGDQLVLQRAGQADGGHRPPPGRPVSQRGSPRGPPARRSAPASGRRRARAR
ncbi:unannotated protein [freshwater metagenome]|uniref:Unannotated protein n=1 Tax=freshwater metagenome TaxID=449393 RepID=A0A6J7GDF3_9ZZZZ